MPFRAFSYIFVQDNYKVVKESKHEYNEHKKSWFLLT